MNDEKRSAAISYIVEFYLNVQYLTEQYSNYQNVMLRFENQYGGDDASSMDEPDKELLSQWVQEVRRLVHKTYIGYSSITDKLKTGKDDAILNIYKVIKTEYIIDRDKLEEYVMKMHSVLINDIIQELLSNNQDLIDGIYRTGNTNKTT